jgi:hypothetical protein
MNNWAIIFNFRFIDWRNQVLCSDNNKVCLCRIDKFLDMQNKLLSVIKKQHPGACQIDFDYETLSSPYI